MSYWISLNLENIIEFLMEASQFILIFLLLYWRTKEKMNGRN